MKRTLTITIPRPKPSAWLRRKHQENRNMKPNPKPVAIATVYQARCWCGWSDTEPFTTKAESQKHAKKVHTKCKPAPKSVTK